MKDQTEKSNLNKRVETSEFNLNFYNPFEIKHRQRTSRSQLKALEKAFATNPKPNGKLRQILAENLSMSPRGIQVWFQNRRAKAKLQLKSRDKSQDDEPNLSSPELLSATSMVHNRSQSSSTDSSWHSDKSDHMVQSTKFDEPWHNCLAEKVSMGPSSLCSSFMNRNSSVFNLNEGWPMTTVAGNVDPLMINNDLADVWAYHSQLLKENTCPLEAQSMSVPFVDHERPVNMRALDDLIFHQQYVNSWVQDISLPVFHSLSNQPMIFDLDETCQQLLQDCVPSFRA